MNPDEISRIRSVFPLNAKQYSRDRIEDESACVRYSLLSKCPPPRAAGSPSPISASASSSAGSSVSLWSLARICRRKSYANELSTVFDAVYMEDTRWQSYQAMISNLPGERVNRCLPDVGMRVEHGAHQSGARSRHTADEYQRHITIVRVPLVIERAHHVFLQNVKRGGRLIINSLAG